MRRDFISMKNLSDSSSDLFLNAVWILQPCWCEFRPPSFVCITAVTSSVFSLPSVWPFPHAFYTVRPSHPAVKTLQDSLLPCGWSPARPFHVVHMAFFCVCLSPVAYHFSPFSWHLAQTSFGSLNLPLTFLCAVPSYFSGLLWFQLLGLEQMSLLLETLPGPSPGFIAPCTSSSWVGVGLHH